MSETVQQEGEFKVKKKPGRPKKLTKTKDETTIKVDLVEKPTQDAIPEPETERVVLPPTGESAEEGKEPEVELSPMGETHTEEQETPNETTEEKIVEEIIEKPIESKDSAPEVPKPSIEVPEHLDKLVNFMNETGGTVEDYVRLNRDYSDVSEPILLREYYKSTRPHLDGEEITFLLEDAFSFDEEVEDEKTIRKKKLAYKEEVAKAKNFLEETKSKYYEELKLRPSITRDQKEAIDFVAEYKKNQEKANELNGFFTAKTNDFFNQEFKGFEFDVGEKSFRYKINNPSETAKAQSNLNTFVKKFLNNDGSVNDYKGYHKAIYAARNADSIAKHFYEQGKADATKDIMAKSKNIQDGKPRATSTGDVFINGLKVRAITGVDGSKLKIKKKNIT